MFKKNDDSVALSNHEHCISQLAMRKSIATNSRQQPRNKRHENHVHKNSDRFIISSYQWALPFVSLHVHISVQICPFML